MSAVEAPAPAPGQRWRLNCGCVVDLGAEKSRYGCMLLASEVKCGSATTHFGWVDAPDWFLGAVYVGPTPGYVPSPATPTPAAAPPTVAGVGGPPAGYRECGMPGCARWTTAPGACWHCTYANEPQEIRRAENETGHSPDWTPPAAPPTREQILAEELRGVGTDAPGTVRDYRMVAPKTAEETAREMATIVRVRAHQLAEGGPSATREAPGRTRDTFADLRDDFDNLPDADAAPVRYRR